MSTFTALVTTAVPPMSIEGRDGYGPPFPFFLIPLFWLLLLGGIAIAVVVARRRRDRLAGALAGERRLAERYAAGEIDETEYRTRRAVLRDEE